MTFPVPPDARVENDFELVKGIDEMIRNSLPIGDLTKPVDEGEWMKRDIVGGVVAAGKIVIAEDIVTPALGAGVSWTRYRPGDASNGQGDALATGTVDLISGNYQAKTKLYNTGSGSLAPGNLLVPIYDAGQLGGILDAVAPAAMTIRQLQSVVGRIIEVAAGVLHYESPGL